MPLIKTKFLID